MEPSQKSYANELSLFLWRHQTHTTATINHLHAPVSLLRSVALVPKFTTQKSGMKAQVSLEACANYKSLQKFVRFKAFSKNHLWTAMKQLYIMYILWCCCSNVMDAER